MNHLRVTVMLKRFGDFFDFFFYSDADEGLKLLSLKRTPYPAYNETHQHFIAACTCSLVCRKRRKHGAFRPQKALRLIRDGEVGGSGILYLTPTRYTVTTRMTALRRAAV